MEQYNLNMCKVLTRKLYYKLQFRCSLSPLLIPKFFNPPKKRYLVHKILLCSCAVSAIMYINQKNNGFLFSVQIVINLMKDGHKAHGTPIRKEKLNDLTLRMHNGCLKLMVWGWNKKKKKKHKWTAGGNQFVLG